MFKSKINIGQDIAISPWLMTAYRSSYWEMYGEKNFHKILGKQTLFGLSDDINPYWHVLRKLLLFYWGPDLFEEVSAEVRSLENSDIVIIYDSYLFFNAGHMPTIEETLDIIQANKIKAKVYFFLDDRLILFPSLAKKIITKYNFCKYIDVTRFTIKLPEQMHTLPGVKKYLDSSLLGINRLLPESIVYSQSLCNLHLSWMHRRKKFDKLTRPAWQASYTTEESFNYIFEFMLNKFCIYLPSKYIVFHLRTSEFLGDQTIRNTLPLPERKNLVDKLISYGFTVFVTGTHSDTQKYNRDRVYYLDQFGDLPDSFQIHLINGAFMVLGNCSGLSSISYCTDTPTLYFDMPFPAFPNMPTFALALLKSLYINQDQHGISAYYSIPQHQYATESRSGHAYSPLMLLGYELKCNSNEQILHAFIELHNKLVDNQKLSCLSDDKTNLIPSALLDKEKIKVYHSTFHKHARVTPFHLDDLAQSNWLTNERIQASSTS